ALKWQQEASSFKEKYEAYKKRLADHNAQIDNNRDKMTSDPDFRKAREVEWRQLQADWKELEGAWYYQHESQYEKVVKTIDWHLHNVYAVLLGEDIQMRKKALEAGEASPSSSFHLAEFPAADQIGEKQIGALDSGASKITRFGTVEITSADLDAAG